MNTNIFFDIVFPVFGVLAFLTFFGIIPLWLIIGKLREHETKEEWEHNVAQIKGLRRGALNNPDIIASIFEKKEYPYYYLLAGIIFLIILWLVTVGGHMG